MRHAELLHDPFSLERGEELVRHFITAAQRLAELDAEEEQLEDHFADVATALSFGALDKDLDEAGFAEIGRKLVDAARNQKANEDVLEDRPLNQSAAYSPLYKFMKQHRGKPIAIAANTPGDQVIERRHGLGSHYPAKIGGFLIPNVIPPNRFYIGNKPKSVGAAGVVRVFGPGSQSRVTVAIGE